MIGLTFTIDDLTTVMYVYDQIQIIRYLGTVSDQPPTPVGTVNSLVDWTVLSGTVDYPQPIDLVPGQLFYQTYDYDGEPNDWYSSRYYSSVDGGYSGWSSPILGDSGDLYYDPEFPAEIAFGTADQRIVDRIRLYIGDPLELRREYGEEAIGSIHPDGKTYELGERGWPVFITMGGKAFNDTLNPSVNGYKYLKFQEYIDDVCTTCSGVTNICGDNVIREIDSGVDIFYYTFRHSDRQIMLTYENCPVPIGLTETTATSQAYMLQTAIDLLSKELWEDATEDGSKISDENSKYDPEAGLKIRKALLDDLRKQLKDLVNSLKLSGIGGVLID